MTATSAINPARGFGWRNILVATAAIALLTLSLTALSFGLSPATGGRPAMTVALIIHVGTVLPALPLGAYILLRRKGGALHRMLGRIWAGLMVTTAISSFWLQEAGHLSFIHIFSVVTLISVPLAVFWIRRGDVARHRRAMTNAYIGLVVAGLFAFAPGRLLGTMLLG